MRGRGPHLMSAAAGAASRPSRSSRRGGCMAAAAAAAVGSGRVGADGGVGADRAEVARL